MGAWFPKHYVENSTVELGMKDSILYLMKDKEFSVPLYYFKRLNKNSNYPIKKNHVFISAVGYFEIYNNGHLRIGGAGPETIWGKQ